MAQDDPAPADRAPVDAAPDDTGPKKKTPNEYLLEHLDNYHQIQAKGSRKAFKPFWRKLVANYKLEVGWTDDDAKLDSKGREMGFIVSVVSSRRLELLIECDCAADQELVQQPHEAKRQLCGFSRPLEADSQPHQAEEARAMAGVHLPPLRVGVEGHSRREIPQVSEGGPRAGRRGRQDSPAVLARNGGRHREADEARL